MAPTIFVPLLRGASIFFAGMMMSLRVLGGEGYQKYYVYIHIYIKGLNNSKLKKLEAR
jgi:hypothetical protein